MLHKVLPECSEDFKQIYNEYVQVKTSNFDIFLSDIIDEYEDKYIKDIRIMLEGYAFDMPSKDISDILTIDTSIEEIEQSLRGTPPEEQVFEDYIDYISIKFKDYSVALKYPKFSILVESMDSLFKDYKGDTLDISVFDTRNVWSMQSMFENCRINKLILCGLNTTKLSTIANMFSGSNLTALDLSDFRVDAVQDMSYVFNDCKRLCNLDLSNWGTSKAETTQFMFSNCHSLRALNISSFDTRQVSDFEEMFSDCRELETLDISDLFKISSTAYYKHITYKCKSGIRNLIRSRIQNN